MHTYKYMFAVWSIVLISTGTASAGEKWGAASSTYFYRYIAGGNYWEYRTHQNEGGEGNFSIDSDLTYDVVNVKGLVSLGLSPVIKGKVTVGNAHWRGDGLLYLAEGFTYTGDEAKTLSMDVALDAVITETPPHGYVYTRVSVWTDDVFYWNTNDNFPTDGRLAWTTMNITTTATTHLERTLTWNVEPGDTFWIWSRMELRSSWANSSTDAWNTMTFV